MEYTEKYWVPKDTYAPNCTLRAEIGASMMKTRIIKIKLNYLKHLLSGKNELLLRMAEIMMEENVNWMRCVDRYMKTLNIGNIGQVSRREIKEKCEEWDGMVWKREIQQMKSLTIYRTWKTEIKEEEIYDNSYASVLWYKARSNTLQLRDRKRHEGGQVSCKICGAEKEDLEHFLLQCTGLDEERGTSTHSNHIRRISCKWWESFCLKETAVK